MNQPSPEARAELAPNGRLRAGINYGNAILARKDAASGESSGIAIELAGEIGKLLGVPVDIVAHDSAGELADGARAGGWDIAFLGSEPAREADMSFTPAYLEIEATYLVKAASALRHASEVDREGITISAPARANYELFLTRTLQHAKLRSVANANAALELLISGEVDALASLKESLLGLAERMPDTRLLEGRFMGVQQSIAVPKGREAGLTFLKDVVEEAKASGMVGRALERLGARGVSVAPPAA